METSTRAPTIDAFARRRDAPRPARSQSLDRARLAARTRVSRRRCLSNGPSPAECRRISRMGQAQLKASTPGWSMTMNLLLNYIKRFAQDPRNPNTHKASSLEELRALYLSTYEDFTRELRLRVSSPGDTIYAHRPMLRTLPEIRLLKFESQPEDAPLRCSTVFWSFPLSPSVYPRSPYYTLSYRWSSPTPGTFLHVDGISMNVSDDLIMALRMALRQVPASVPLVIWVDAICINQQDDLERMYQVNIMNHIYSACRGSFVWLGFEEDDSNKAMDLMAEVARIHDEWFEQLTRARQMVKPASGPLAQSQSHKAALAPLLSRSYWERLWIVQEVLLSPQKLLLCGDRRVDWLQFHKFLTHQSLHPDEDVRGVLQTVGASAANLVNIDGFFNTKGRSLQTTLGLLDALSISRSRKCTDPKDHVYAILGITKTPILPDYKKPTSWVWTLAALVAIEEDKSLNVLSLSHAAHETRPEADQTDLPSWVPNLAQDRSLASHIYLGDPTGHRKRFEVFGSSRPSPAVPIDVVKVWQASSEALPSPLRLRVAAHVVDRVKYCHTSTQRGDILQIWQHWSRYLLDASAPLTMTYDSVQDRAAAFTDVVLLHQPKKAGEKSEGGRVPIARPWVLSHLEQTGPDDPIRMLGLHHETRLDLEMAVLQPLRVYMDTVHSDFTIFYTEGGYIGMGVNGVEAGDEVCLVGGCDVPLVLRGVERPPENDGRADFCFKEIFSAENGKAQTPIVQQGEGRSVDGKVAGTPDDYRVVGECYVSGLMYGEFFSVERSSTVINLV